MNNVTQAFPYAQQVTQPVDINKQIHESINNILYNSARQSGIQQQPVQSAQIPVYTCQPVKNIDEVDNMKWFNEQPFFGVDESGQYIFKREWDSKIPAANTVIYKRIERSELPKPPQPVTHDELAQLIPAVLAQYIPKLLEQMGVTGNEQQSAVKQSAEPAAASAEHTQQLPTDTGGVVEGAVRAKSGKASGDK